MNKPYELYKDVLFKIKKMCDDNNWEYDVNTQCYPFSIRFTRLDLPLINGMDSEMYVEFRFDDEIVIEMNNENLYGVPEKLFNNMKSLAKEAHRLYMLHCFITLRDVPKMAFVPMWSASTNPSQVVGILDMDYMNGIEEAPRVREAKRAML